VGRNEIISIRKTDLISRVEIQDYVREWEAYLLSEKATGTANAYVKGLSLFLDWLDAEGFPWRTWCLLRSGAGGTAWMLRAILPIP
jgi:hypothetical protein